MPITLERLRELALEVSTANGVCKTLRALGRNTDTEELDYQAAVMAFDAGLTELWNNRMGDQAGQLDPTPETARVCPSCRGFGKICIGTSGRDDDGNAPEYERCEECLGTGSPI